MDIQSYSQMIFCNKSEIYDKIYKHGTSQNTHIANKNMFDGEICNCFEYVLLMAWLKTAKTMSVEYYNTGYLLSYGHLREDTFKQMNNH